jgi:hypothetical protein
MIPQHTPPQGWVKPNTIPFDTKWKSNLSAQWWSVYSDPEFQDLARQFPKERKLSKILLQFGGEDACCNGLDPDIDLILKQGQIWLGGDNVIHIPQESRQCHANALNLYLANKDLYSLATGYYLLEDGMWRSHTWCVYQGKVVESTIPAILYYGTLVHS